MAEHVLGIVPKGTHTWSKYVTPAELQEYVTLSGATTLDTCGMVYNPICKTWHLDGHDLGMNYITSCRKNPQEV
jgi:2-polyprenyl-3-methyl-5-hydroxy-6-metoxy-1,4-benzoquinol methylase